MRELRRFLIAVGYFTRVPIPAWVGWAQTELNRATRYFPLVGMLVGMIGASALYVAAKGLPLALAVALSMLATIVVTGAFHEDGLADSADGFGGGWEKAQVLAIMKDSRLGTFGAIALVAALALKFIALYSIAVANLPTALLALPVCHSISRTAALAIMATHVYVREDGSSRSKPVAEGIGFAEWGIGIALGSTPLLVACWLGPITAVRSVTLAIAVVVATTLIGRYFRRRIGGYTGDCLGATQQVTEIAAYIVLCWNLPQ